MSKVLDQCRDTFGSVIRNRGQAYFDGRLVSPIRMRSRPPVPAGFVSMEFEADVKGSDNYRVEVALDTSARELHLDCDCPYYEEGEFCKHIWAVLLKADREFLKEVQLPSGQDLTVIHQWDRDLDTDDNENEEERIVNPRAPTSMQQWRMHLMRLKFSYSGPPSLRPSAKKASSAPYYVLQVGDRKYGGGVGIEFREMPEGKSKLKRVRYSADDALTMRDPLDREIVSMLLLIAEASTRGYGGYAVDGCRLDGDERAGAILWRLAETGRLIAFPNSEKASPIVLTKDPDETPWGLKLRIQMRSDGRYEPQPLLIRHTPSGQQELSFLEPWFIFESGVMGSQAGVLSRLDRGTGFHWLGVGRDSEFPAVPAADLPEFLKELSHTPGCPPLEFDDTCGWRQETPVPTPKLVLQAPDATSGRRLSLQLYFEYENERVLPGVSRTDQGMFLSVNASTRAVEIRNTEFEEKTLRHLAELTGVAIDARGAGTLERECFSDAIHDVLEKGWRVEASRGGA